MSLFVLDASIAIAWFVDRPIPPLAVRAKQALLAGDRAVVPSLWHIEVANSLIMAERRRVLDAADLVKSLDDIEQVVIQAIDTSPETLSIRQAHKTARAFHLTAYDALYLDLAREGRLALATLDQALRAAAEQADVELFR